MSNTTSKLAKTSPINLLFSPHFWRKNILFGVGLIGCIIGLLGASLGFFPYSSQELNDLMAEGSMDLITVFLYLFIYVFAFIGLALALYTVAKIHVESAIADRIFTKSKRKLIDIQDKGRKRIELSELKKMIPQNTDKRFESAMIRLFTLIYNEAKDRRFESSVILMNPYRDESNGDIFQTSIFQKIVLQLGILGTFIGLINAFNDLNLGELDTSLTNISAALKYAFSTSIAGLIAAILLGVILFFLKRKQEGYFKIMEKASSKFISLARNSLNDDAYLNSLTALGHQVEQSNQQTKRLKEKIMVQTEALYEGMEKLGKTKEDFDTFLKGIEELEQNFMQQMAQIYETLSPDNMGKKLKKSLEKATQNYLEETKQKYDELNKLVKKTNQNIGNMDTQLGKQVEYMGKNTKNQKDFIDKVTGSHITTQLVEIMKTTNTQLTSTLENQIDNLVEQFIKYQAAFDTFNRSTIHKHRKTIYIMGGIIAFLLVTSGMVIYPYIAPLFK